MGDRFRPDQLERYARQIVLGEIGGRGQEKLLRSRVFVMGAGGLGSAAILYLAAAGVGTIDVADEDDVDLSNLHRQIVHTTNRVGTSKAESAKATANALNPDVNVIAHDLHVDERNIDGLIRPVDVVIDGSDNFPTRYLVNEACLRQRKPLVTGAMFRFEGVLTVFPMTGADDSPCYRCVFPEAPPRGLVPTCQESGVLGPVAGVVGALQAAEAIKLLLEIGQPMTGRMLTFDALEMQFRETSIRRRPKCPLH